MDPSLYNAVKVLHIFAVLTLFTGLGGLALESYIGGGEERKGRKLTGISQGLGLLLLIGTGLAMVQTAGLGGWVWMKLVLWLFFGVVVVLIRRLPGLAALFWFVLPILGAFAAFLAIYKPF